MKFIQQAIKTMEVCDADLEFLVSNSWMILVTVMSMICRLANFNSFSIAIFICEREKGGRRRKGGSTTPQRMCHYLGVYRLHVLSLKVVTYHSIVELWDLHSREKVRGNAIKERKVYCCQLGYIHVFHC